MEKERANLCYLALERLEATGVDIAALICDGPQNNKAMLRELGASLDHNELRPFFYTPTGKKIFVLLDVAHMLKLVRNCWERHKIFVDQDGQIIDWDHIVQLEAQQDREGLRGGTKVTKRHVNFHREKMSVKLAAQLLSSSSADLIEYCDQYLKLDQFKNSQGTVKFIRLIDHLFDLLNSRNPWAKGFKAPIHFNSGPQWQGFIHEAAVYLKNLKDNTGKLMCNTQSRTPFIGFLLAIHALEGMYDDYVQTRKLKYLLTYKLSQDQS